VGISDVSWTKGFGQNVLLFAVMLCCHNSGKLIPARKCAYSFQNFRVAAGLDTGRFRGPSFHDGDFYKTLEAVAAMYANTKDKKLEAWMDEAIAVIGKAQKQDGYIYTKNIIEQKNRAKKRCLMIS
jgi:uncharacterized protein